MIPRTIQSRLLLLAGKFPVVSLTGPRQSGKTTLLQAVFPNYRYVNLEEPDTRLLAESDPRKFLGGTEPLIIDEIQRFPALFSYLQVASDAFNQEGRYIISGSQSFLLNQHVSQSLAGRVAILTLLPLCFEELSIQQLTDPDQLLFKGFFPRIYDKNIEPTDFFPNYIQTYLERDVRLLQNIHDHNQFVRFLKLCAGRIGQLLNMTSLANDCGISVNTAKSWLSVLEASFIIFFLQPDYKNFNKRLVKMPKLYFTDTGLACSLLQVNHASQLEQHYLKGALFENLILCEIRKKILNQGLPVNLSFWRDNKGLEIDCILEIRGEAFPIEIKSSSTYHPDFLKNLAYWNKLSGNPGENAFLVYAGEQNLRLKDGQLISWKNLHEIFSVHGSSSD